MSPESFAWRNDRLARMNLPIALDYGTGQSHQNHSPSIYHKYKLKYNHRGHREHREKPFKNDNCVLAATSGLQWQVIITLLYTDSEEFCPVETKLGTLGDEEKFEAIALGLDAG